MHILMWFPGHTELILIGVVAVLLFGRRLPEVGRNLGRSLIEFVYAQAAEAGAERVYWLTHESNRPGRLLYDRVAENAGFIQYRKNLEP